MANIVLFSWPLVAVILYLGLGPSRGLIWTFLIGYLFLPEALEFNLPGLPPYDKNSALGVSCFIGLLIAWKRKTLPRHTGTFEQDKIVHGTNVWLCVVFLLAPMLTILTNREPVLFPSYSLPGLGFRDYISFLSAHVFLVLPFFAAKALLHEESIQKDFLVALVVMGVTYSAFVLFERRMSPQLHSWTYGYFQHQWAQHIRGGGFRPVVFLKHGLHLGFFLFAVTIAAFALTRAPDQRNRNGQFLIAAIWLFLVLAVSRNLGALVIACAFVPVVIFAHKRLQLWVMFIVAVLLLSYPALQLLRVIPNDSIVATAERISIERASSLQFRIDQEQALLERAATKPAFGWGGWARWRIYDAAGNDLSTVDGLWISTFGGLGWVGYLAYFGFLTAPLIFLGRAMRQREISHIGLGLALIMSGNLIYMLPNAAGSPFSWLMAGAIMGLAQWRPNTTESSIVEDPSPRNSYTRFSRKDSQLT